MQKLQADDLTGRIRNPSDSLALSRRGKPDGVRSFKDVLAERFHDAAYDREKFQDDSLQRPGIVTRTAILDAQVKAFVADNSDLLVVNLGAGLDTRFHS
jgi:O-methyltransferase involved in polyketide biosynthesis